MSSCSVKSGASRRWLWLLQFVAAMLPTAGCRALCKQVRWCPYCPPECQLSEDATSTEIIAHINANADRLYSWRSTSASIRARAEGGLPVTLSANIAIARPRQFRLRASLLGANEVDLGSNAERFWFWIRRSEQPYVITVGHKDLPRVRKQLSLPFEPDWLVEALGVSPLAAGEWSVASSRPSQHRLTLVAERRSPRGGRVRRQLVVDTCLGVVSEQALYDESASLIARATLDDHRKDSETGIVVPRRIELEWPEAELSLVIRLKDIEVNPSPIPASTWEVPRGLGSGPIDLVTRQVLR